MRVLLVEDDEDLAAALTAALPRHGFSADVAGSVEEADAMVAAVRYAAVLLDLGLPGEDGATLLRRVRDRGDKVPVIVISARARTDQRIKQLDAGADDYLVKTFDIEELVARVRAVVRRGDARHTDVVEHGNVAIDLATGQLIVSGAPVALSQRETQLMRVLFRRPGRVVARDHVEGQLFGLGDAGGPNAVEVYIHRLRRKLAAAGADAKVETVRGVGYMGMLC